MAAAEVGSELGVVAVEAELIGVSAGGRVDETPPGAHLRDLDARLVAQRRVVRELDLLGRRLPVEEYELMKNTNL